jgi:hypothetical protein
MNNGQALSGETSRKGRRERKEDSGAKHAKMITGDNRISEYDLC